MLRSRYPGYHTISFWSVIIQNLLFDYFQCQIREFLFELMRDVIQFFVDMYWLGYAKTHLCFKSFDLQSLSGHEKYSINTIPLCIDNYYGYTNAKCDH